MTEQAFRSKRRQKFLTEKYFELNRKTLLYLMDETLKAIPERKAEGDLDPFGEGGMFKDSLRLLRLHYTGGDSIESLRPLFVGAMKWFEEWHRAEETYSAHLAKKRGEDLRLDMTPVEFENLFDFQLALEVVSIGILLGEGDAVRHAAALMQSARHTDMLYEGLIAAVVADPDTDTTEFFHTEPYDPLIDAFYTAENSAKASQFIKLYLDNWYKAFEGAPWHNGHLTQTDEYSNYEGYWAFEAAAICVIYDIDDSSFRNHIVYPKDLADWAREYKVLERIKSEAGLQSSHLSCDANQPCPRAGYWVTPAKTNSRRLFKQGELMPEFKSDYGMTIWQWDTKQS